MSLKKKFFFFFIHPEVEELMMKIPWLAHSPFSITPLTLTPLGSRGGIHGENAKALNETSTHVQVIII